MITNVIDQIRYQIKWLTQQIECLKDKGCLCFSFETALEYNEETGELSATFVDDSTRTVTIPSSTEPTGLEALDEGNGIGWRLIGRPPANYGNIGNNAIDFSDLQSGIGATGKNSFAIGTNVIASGENSFATSFGDATAYGAVAFSGGNATATNAFAMGSFNTSSGNNSFSFGGGNTASGENSVSGGYLSQIAGLDSVGIGYNLNVGGNYSASFGNRNVVFGNNSFVAGYQNRADGNDSFSVGSLNSSSGSHSTTIGQENDAEGDYSFAGGDQSEATGLHSFAFGKSARALADDSVSFGGVANSYKQFSIGQFGVSPTVNSTSVWIADDLLFSVENGTNNVNRSDAFLIYKSGLITAPSLTNSIISNGPSSTIITKDYVDNNFIPNSELGITNGVATLNSNGKLETSQVPNLAITDIIIATETTIGDFVTNNASYTFEQGDVIILDSGNGDFYMYNGASKNNSTSYSQISASQINWSQITNKPTTIAGYGITDAVPTSRTISAGTGLTGGGNLTANRTISANFGTTSGTIAQGNDSRINNGQTAFSWGNHASQNYAKMGIVNSGSFNATGRAEFGTGGEIIKLNGNNTGDSSINYIGFYESNGTTRQAYIGFPSSSHGHFIFRSDVSDKNLELRSDGGLNYNGNSNFTGIMTAGGFTLSNSGFTGTLNATLTANRFWFMPNFSGTVAMVGSSEPNSGIFSLDGEIQVNEIKLNSLNTAPASATAPGVEGEIRITSNYIYVCIAGNTWVRSALTTW